MPIMEGKRLQISLDSGKEINLYSAAHSIPIDVCYLKYNYCSTSNTNRLDGKDKPHKNEVSGTEEDPAYLRGITNPDSPLSTSSSKNDALKGIVAAIDYISKHMSTTQADINILWQIHKRIDGDVENEIDDAKSVMVAKYDEFIKFHDVDSKPSHEREWQVDSSGVSPYFQDVDAANDIVEIVPDMNISHLSTGGNGGIPDMCENDTVTEFSVGTMEVEKSTTHDGTTQNIKKLRYSGKQRYECAECDQKFQKHRTFSAHMRMHAGLRPYECKICKKLYQTSVGLKTHSLLHTNVEFQCEKCGKTFKTPGNLYTHKLTHEDMKYSCPVCGKKSRTSSANVHHMKIHTGEKSHRCRFCEKSFIGSTDLRRYTKRHHTVTF